MCKSKKIFLAFVDLLEHYIIIVFLAIKNILSYFILKIYFQKNNTNLFSKKKSSTKIQSMNANQEHHDKTHSDVTQKKNRHDEGRRNQDKEDLRRSLSEQHNKRMQQELHVSNRYQDER